MNQPVEEYYPNLFVQDCCRFVGKQLNVRLETERVSSLVEALPDKQCRDRLISFLWLVLYFVPLLSRNHHKSGCSECSHRDADSFGGLLVSDGFINPILWGERVDYEEMKMEDTNMCLPEGALKRGDATAWELCKDGWNLDFDVLPVMVRSVISLCRYCNISPADLIDNMDKDHEADRANCLARNEEFKAFYAQLKSAILNEASAAPVLSIKEQLQNLRDCRNDGSISEEAYKLQRETLEAIDVF